MDGYLREETIIDKSEDEKKIELIMSVLKAKRELELAIKNFETAEAELIDYYAYQIKAEKAKLDYLIKEVKNIGVRVDIINNIEILLKETRAI